MSTGTDRPRRFDEQRLGQFLPTTSPTRHDFVLAAIPSAFLLTILVAGVFGFSLRMALTSASLMSVVPVLDALFVNPPTRGDRRGET